jgi:hypothetical protein
MRRELQNLGSAHRTKTMRTTRSYSTDISRVEEFFLAIEFEAHDAALDVECLFFDTVVVE